MGQAKRRGTFEERKAQAHQRWTEEMERRRKETEARDAAWDAAHPDSRPRRRLGNPSMLVAHLAMMAAICGPTHTGRRRQW